MITIDTSVLIELEAGNLDVYEKLKEIRKNHTENPALPFPCFSEFYYGILRSKGNIEACLDFLNKFTLLHSTQNSAKLFAENGALFVIGSHPHIILSSEKIPSDSGGQDRNTVVYYSLGNFIFDQYWNKEVSTGLLLELNIKNKNITVVEHKVNIGRDGRTCLADVKGHL